MLELLKSLFTKSQEEKEPRVFTQYTRLPNIGPEDIETIAEILQRWNDAIDSESLRALLSILDDVILHKSVQGTVKTGDAGAVIECCEYKGKNLYKIGPVEFNDLDDAIDYAENACFTTMCVFERGRKVWLVNGKIKFNTYQEALDYTRERRREWEEQTGRKSNPEKEATP